MSTAVPDFMGTWQDQVEGALSAAGLKWHETNDLGAHMHRTRTALAELQQTQEQARAILNNQQYQHQYRTDTADAMRSEAQAKASATINDLQAAAEKVQQKVGSFWQVSKPKDVSDPALYDRKSDIQRILDTAGDGPRVAELAGQLLEEANTSGDQLTSHVLTSLLQHYFRARGVDEHLVSAMFAASSPSKAAALAPIVGSKNSSGALNNFIREARSQVSRTLAGMKSDSDATAMEALGMAQAARTFGGGY